MTRGKKRGPTKRFPATRFPAAPVSTGASHFRGDPFRFPTSPGDGRRLGAETTWPQMADVENHRFGVQAILEKDGKGYIEMFSKCPYITSSGFELPRHCDIMFDTLTISARIFTSFLLWVHVSKVWYPRIGDLSDLLHVIYLSKFLSNLSTPSI